MSSTNMKQTTLDTQQRKKYCHDVKTQELPSKGTGWTVWFLWVQTLHDELHDMMVFSENPWHTEINLKYTIDDLNSSTA